MNLACLLMRIYVGLSVCTHMHTYVSISFFCLSMFSVHAHVCTKAPVNAYFVVYRGPFLLLNIHYYLTYDPANLHMLTSGNATSWHCAVSNELSLFERKILLYYIAKICPIVCAFATREESQNYNFLFSAPSVCPQSNVQVSTADNLWKQFRPDKMFSRECLLLQTRISLRCSRKTFPAPISVLYHLLLVSSADNLFKQLGRRSD